MTQATAWFRYYNPLLQKPTALEPVMPWGFWWYYGPDPAAGCSYGKYKSESGHEVITPKANTVYSPVDGKPMELIETVDLSTLNGAKEATADKAHRYQCESCQSTMVSSVELLDEGHCTSCGCKMSYGHSENKETKTMEKIDLKEKVRAHILKKRAEAQTVKAEDKKDAEASVQLKEKQREALRARIKARLAERKAKAAAEPADEWVDLDEVLSGEAKANEECADEVVVKDDEAAEAKEAVKEEAKEAVKDAVDEAVDEAEEVQDKEEFMPLDMVLSALERKQRIERIRASLANKRKARAEAKAKADAAVEAAPAAPAKTEVEAKQARAAKVAAFKERIAAKLKARAAVKVKAEEEAPAPAPVEEEKKAPAPEAAESEMAPGMEAKEAAPAVPHADDLAKAGEEEKPMEVLEQASEAMKYEPLAALEQLKVVAREDIDMIRYDEDSENPFWNVSVKGTPVARVSLKAQVSSDEIRNVFISDEYAMDLIEHCATSGLVDTLKKVNAFFYANHTSDKKVAASYKGAADKAIAIAKADLTASFRSEFTNCLRVAVAGINKNFYPQLGNPLKEELYNNMKTLGLPDASAKSIVEKSFAEASAEYFDSIFTKAEEYMKLAPETRAEIADAISQAASIDPSATEAQEPATLSNRLAQASVAPQLSFQNPIVVDTEDYKQRLKRAWKPSR